MKSLKSITLFTVLFLLVSSTRSSAQKIDTEAITDSIMKEADVLYKSEWASWYGGDIFAEKCKTLHQLSAGYISYDTGQGLNNIYFSKDAEPVVLATITFGYDFNTANYKLDTVKRKFTINEKELHTIRQIAIADIYKDTLYKRYNNTNFNPVPIISNNKKRVYVLTGTNSNGIVIIGNDYLITFDDNNKLVSKKMLHKNIIPLQSDKTSIASIHSHLPSTGDFITATDICTLRLYEGFTNWQNHTVISKNYVSIWDCKKNILAILTREAWDKINATK